MDEAIGVTLNPSSSTSVAVASYNIIGINSNGLTATSGVTNTLVGNNYSSDVLLNDSYTNPTNAPVDVVYTIVPLSAQGVEGGAFTLTVTVNPELVVADQEPIEVCSGEEVGVNFNASTSIAAATYNITALNLNGLTVLSGNPSVSSGLLASALSDDSFRNTTNAPVDVVYTVVPYDAIGCDGASFTVTVTVNPAPVVLNQTVLNISSRNPVSVSFNASTGSSIATATYNITALNLNGLTVVSGNPSVSSGLLASALSDDSFRNTTNAPVDVIYTVVPISASGCEGDAFTVSVTIRPEPVVANQTAIVCMDEAIGVTLNPSSSTSVAVASYNIIDIDSNGLSAKLGVTNMVIGAVIASDGLKDDSYSNNSNNPVDVVYTLVPVSSDGVEGVAFTLTVTVNPKPIVADQEKEVCSGEELGIDFNASSTIAVASYEITGILIDGTTNITGINTITGLSVGSGNPRQGAGLSANEISNDSFINTTNAPVTVVYTVVPYDAIGCNGDPFTVTVTVNPAPVVGNQTGTVNSRAPITVTLGPDTDGVPVISSYKIKVITSTDLTAGTNNRKDNDVIVSNGIFNDTFINQTSSLKSVLYTIVPVSAGDCEGEAFTVRVIIRPEPVVADQGPIKVCSDDPIAVTLNQSISSSVSVDKYSIDNYTYNGLTVTTGNATITGGILSDDSYTNNSNNPVDLVYTIVPISDQGGVEVKGAAFRVTVTVNPAPKVANQGPIEVCSGEALGVSFNASSSIAAATYKITALNLNGLTEGSGNPSVSSGLLASALSDDSFINETNAPVNVIYTVVPVSAEGCEGEEFTVTVTVNPAPVVDDITKTVNSGDLIGVTLAPVTGSTPIFNYKIKVITSTDLTAGTNNRKDNDVIVSNGIFNDTFINQTSSLKSVLYTIVPVSAGDCEGEAFTVRVIIRPEPVVADQGPIKVCSDDPIAVTLNQSISSSVSVDKYSIDNYTYNGLTVTTGNATITGGILSDDSYTNNSNNPVDLVYTIVPISDQGGVEVKGAAFRVTVTVNPAPKVANQGPIEVCSGEALGVSFNASSSIAAATYKITALNLNGLTEGSGNPSVSSGLLASALSDDSFINETNAPVNVIYTVVPVSAEGCEGEEFTVTVTVNPAPVVDDITKTVNSGDLIGVNLVDDPAVSSYIIDDINTNGLQADLNNSSINDVVLYDGIFNDSYTNLSSSIVDVIYTITPVSDFYCKGAAFTVRVTIKPGPVVANQAVTVCSDEPIEVILNPSTSVAVASYNIIGINSNGLTPTSGVTNTLVGNNYSSDVLKDDSYTNNSKAPVDVVYTIVPVSSQGVRGEEFTVTVTLNPAPVVADQAIEVCSGEDLGVDFNASTSINAATYNIIGLELNGLTAVSGNPAERTGLLASDLSDDSFINETNAPVNVIYTVVPVSASGCEGEEFTVTVRVNNKLGDPAFSITPSDLFGGLFAADDPISFKNTSSGPYASLTWYIDGKEVSDQEEFTYTFDRIGSYEVILEVGYVDTINNFACIYTKSETINVTEKFDLIIPNAFTPNDDGINDTIKPIFKYIDNIEMSIYDVWGVLLYYERGNSVLNGWDGYVKGKPAGIGNYTMIVKGTTFSGKNFVKNTAIRLIR
jgi:gliding motility-associated-like protein